MGTIHRLPHSQPEISQEARLLVEALAGCDPGAILTYAAMRAVTGLDIQHKRRDLLQTALKMVLREQHKVFGAVTGQGMKCLGSAGIVGVGEDKRRRMQRMAKRTIEKLSCVLPDDLSLSEQHRWLAYVSIMGAAAALSHAKSVQHAIRLQGAQPKPLDPALYKDLLA